VLLTFVLLLTLSALSCGDGGDDLEQVSAPVISPDGGIGDYFDVTITTSTDGAEIRYTTDGSTPTSSSGVIYSGVIPVYKTMTINAIAYKDSMSDSDVTESNIFQLRQITIAIDSAGDVGSHTSISVDGCNVYISYFDNTNHYLKFAKSENSGESWLGSPDIESTIDTTGDVGELSSIAVDGSNVYISYYDETNGDLKFAKSIDGGVSWE
jgi:hypothetical protein